MKNYNKIEKTIYDTWVDWDDLNSYAFGEDKNGIVYLCSNERENNE